MEPDFTGYVTKADLKCSDGLTIKPNAFAHDSGTKVPLVWQHGHTDPNNVLGHVMLENRADGVYGYGFFNGTPNAQSIREAVRHGDINAMSIYANKLVKKGKDVLHGAIREVSLVLAGANPGAHIDYVNLQHGADTDELENFEAIHYTGLEFEHTALADDSEDISEETPVVVEHAESTDSSNKGEQPVAENTEKTVKDVFDSMSEDQQQVVYFMVGQALESQGNTVQQGAFGDDDFINHQNGDYVNVFEQDDEATEAFAISHADMKGIVASAIKGGSLKDAVDDYAIQHGIENIDILFPDAKAISDRPEFLSRRMEWVSKVLGGTKHTPFSRIKTLHADITMDEARAKGYIKGNMKKDEFFSLLRRTTEPTTIYKKQKLDRDDVLDITDFDVIAWMKAEMRIMLDEELARAILIGDGREVDDEDKINELKLRPIATDNDMYAVKVYVDATAEASSADAVVDQIILQRKHYHGSGSPTLYTTEDVVTKMLMAKDTLGRRLYNTEAELAYVLRVANIVPVEVMETEPDLLGIIVNLADYSVGADRGGEVTLFDDFDIDYNQQKYLIETRVSGALTKLRSALVLKKAAVGSALAEPTAPTRVDNVVTIPTDTDTVYTDEEGVVLTQASTVTLTALNSPYVIKAIPATGKYFATSANSTWTFRVKA